MKVLALVRRHSGLNELENQRRSISEYTRKQNLKVEQFLDEKILPPDLKENEIHSIMLEKLSVGDTLLVTELSRMGKNLLQALNLIEILIYSGIKIIFINQPELSIISQENQSVFFFLYYIAATEREFISMRTKKGLAAAQAKGKLLGRPKGSRNKKGRVLDPFKNNIRYYLEINIPIQSIMKLINRKLSVPVSYNTLKYFIENDMELKLLRKQNSDT